MNIVGKNKLLTGFVASIKFKVATIFCLWGFFVLAKNYSDLISNSIYTPYFQCKIQVLLLVRRNITSVNMVKLTRTLINLLINLIKCFWLVKSCFSCKWSYWVRVQPSLKWATACRQKAQHD